MKKKLVILSLCLLLCGCSAAQAESEVVIRDSSSEASGSLSSDPLKSLPEPEPPETNATAGDIPPEVRERMEGVSYTDESPVSWEKLSYVTVQYLDFDGTLRTGHIIVHKTLEQDVAEIFEELLTAGFPIAKITLIDDYAGDDNLSMADNNTYAYCTRRIAGAQSDSLHSYGIAIDINPVQNPYVLGGIPQPEQAAEYMDRTDVRPGMIVPGDVCYTAFTSRGWSWGGHWAAPDYQHFEKRL